jgi:hypothetical protein
MQVSPAPHYGLLDSDCRLAAMARSVVRLVRSTMYEMKFGLIGFAIGTMAITGATFASAPKKPVTPVAAVEAPAQDMLWPVLEKEAKPIRD